MRDKDGPPIGPALNDLISVIIPNFNGQGTLERAVTSVLFQSHAHVQLIVVDDCSTDNSVAFLKQRFSDPRLLIEEHPKNRMLGATRNTGISLAEGAYLFFLDADDFLLPEALRSLLTCAKEFDADVVQGASLRLTANGRSSIYHQCEFISKGGIDGLQHFSYHRFASVAWNKLYRKDLFENGASLRFIEQYMHEDVPFAMACAFKAQRIVSIAKPVLCYTENKNPMVQRAPNRFSVESYVFLYLKLIDLCENFGLHSDPTGIVIARRIMKAHGTDDIIPKLMRCHDEMGRPRFEDTLSEVGFTMAGRHGMATANLISEFTTLLVDTQAIARIQKSQGPLRIITRFFKKRGNRAG
jgi:glycosyltransferase involved in cell wall biosynthesis